MTTEFDRTEQGKGPVHKLHDNSYYMVDQIMTKSGLWHTCGHQYYAPRKAKFVGRHMLTGP